MEVVARDTKFVEVAAARVDICPSNIQLLCYRLRTKSPLFTDKADPSILPNCCTKEFFKVSLLLFHLVRITVGCRRLYAVVTAHNINCIYFGAAGATSVQLKTHIYPTLPSRLTLSSF